MNKSRPKAAIETEK